MNTKMLEHPATQRNLKLLQDYGYQIIQPREATSCFVEIKVLEL